MSSVIEYHTKSYTAGAALGAYVRVKKSGSTVVAAGAGEAGIGVTIHNVANGEPVTVRLFNGFGTAFMKASAPIVQNAPVYGTANGKVDDAGTGPFLGFAEEAATADNDVIEVLLRGEVALPMIAHADQAAATDAGTTQALANALRSALISFGLIKGSA